jgi:ribonuclease P protein component
LIQKFTYNKNQKLKSRKELDNLFKNGKSFLVFPLKVYYFFSDVIGENNLKCGVGVSKKHYAKAVDRNRIKRLLREGFRLNNIQLQETIQTKQLSFFVLYIDKEMPTGYAAIENKMKQVMLKLIKKHTDEMAS